MNQDQKILQSSSLVTGLAERVDLTKILAYSGWNTAGNALGITVGHAAARAAFLAQEAGFGVPLYEQAAEHSTLRWRV